jgi:hypothetical protein
MTRGFHRPSRQFSLDIEACGRRIATVTMPYDGFGEKDMANVVLPNVRLFVPCLGVTLEKGKPRAIRSPLHTIRMPAGVADFYLLDELWFNAVLTDGVGRFALSVELHNEDGLIAKKSA